MKPLSIDRRVGENVTIRCSDWDVWISVKDNVKYFCDSPCTEDHHIIIKAAYGDTTYKNRLKLYNEGEGLLVTFTNLQKSDSKTYFCGVERSGRDSFIKVILNVIDAHPPSPKTTPKTIIVGSTPSFAVTYNSTMSSNVSDIITEMSTSYTTLNTTTPTASATQGAGIVPYLISGMIFIFAVLVVSLILTRNMIKKQLMVVSTPQEDSRESAGPDEVYQSLHPLTMDEDQVYSTLTPTNRSAGPDEVYQSLHPLTMDKDQVYSNFTPTESV
ncbi:CMRF35-like molecule 3 isoform X2 [Cebidichthys violaceus]